MTTDAPDRGSHVGLQQLEPRGALKAGLRRRPAPVGSGREAPSTWLVNGTISAVLLVAFAVISTALGDEIYRCNFLEVPNCD